MMASAGNGKRQGQNREAKRKRKTKRRKAAASISSPQGATTTCFWRDPDAEFCCICSDDEEDGEHSELNCPYNYLSPASYVPCRARLTIWNDEVFKPYQTFGRFPKPTRQDRAFARRRESLRRVVRVTNLPPSCCRPASAARRLITGLFAQFGPLRMYHVVEEDDDEEDVCVGGIGCVVFDRREDAEKAIDELNCYVVDGHSLRVDWVYPYCGK